MNLFRRIPLTQWILISMVVGSSVGWAAPDFAVIPGRDELMDMARTSVNQVGACLATVVMAPWEGEFDPAAAPMLAIPGLQIGHPEPALVPVSAVAVEAGMA